MLVRIFLFINLLIEEFNNLTVGKIPETPVTAQQINLQLLRLYVEPFKILMAQIKIP